MLTDFDGDGKLDIVYGNWNGPHRLFLQTADDEGRPKFRVGCKIVYFSHKERCRIHSDIVFCGVTLFENLFLLGRILQLKNLPGHLPFGQSLQLISTMMVI